MVLGDSGTKWSLGVLEDSDRFWNMFRDLHEVLDKKTFRVLGRKR